MSTHFKNLMFKPAFNPKKMLDYGVFGGWYFKEEIDEYPKKWFENAKISADGFNQELNYFGVTAGQSMSVWVEKRWITPEDQLGWFQWYCRYYMGRRIPSVDEFQIKRWKAFGPRHIGGIQSNCEPKSFLCRHKQRQVLLQWAYDPFI